MDQAEKSSYEHSVVLFKHSVTCGISSFAKSKIDDMAIDENFKFYYLDLLSHRDISNEIASRFGVIHQSPQIVIVRNGKAIFDVSHHAIESSIIKNNI